MTKLIIVPKLSEMPEGGIFSDMHNSEADALKWGEGYQADSVVVFHRKGGKSILAALVFKKGENDTLNGQ